MPAGIPSPAWTAAGARSTAIAASDSVTSANARRADTTRDDELAADADADADADGGGGGGGGAGGGFDGPRGAGAGRRRDGPGSPVSVAPSRPVGVSSTSAWVSTAHEPATPLRIVSINDTNRFLRRFGLPHRTAGLTLGDIGAPRQNRK
ncbi:hypothetical protein BCD49_15185 [Pseudofrankia sp. EUN1h]|nr:hypothetical protein BCD49_15185 [Pseudofrankia sp. EUN1h]